MTTLQYRRNSFQGNLPSLNALTERVVGLAIEVHRALGSGLRESVYEAAMAIELEAAAVKFERQKSLAVIYKGQVIGDFHADLVVENTPPLELKSAERHDPLFEAQLLTFLFRSPAFARVSSSTSIPA